MPRGLESAPPGSRISRFSQERSRNGDDLRDGRRVSDRQLHSAGPPTGPRANRDLPSMNKSHIASNLESLPTGPSSTRSAAAGPPPRTAPLPREPAAASYSKPAGGDARFERSHREDPVADRQQNVARRDNRERAHPARLTGSASANAVDGRSDARSNVNAEERSLLPANSKNRLIVRMDITLPALSAESGTIVIAVG